VSENRNPREYFRELVNRNMEAFNVASFIPPMAMEWVTEEEEVTRALDTLGDLNECTRSIRELDHLIVKLDTAVNGIGSLYVFTRLREGRREAILTANKVARLRDQILAAEETSFGEQGLSGELINLRKERQSLEHDLQGLPVSDEDMYAQDHSAVSSVADSRKELSRAEIQIEGLEAILAAIEKYLKDTNNQGLSISVSDEVRLQKLGIASYRNEIEKIKEGLDRLEILSASGASKSEEQKGLRKRIADLSERERKLMAGKGGLSRKADGLIAKLDAVDVTVSGFMRGLEEEATRRVKDLKTKIEVEKAHVVEYQAELERLKLQAEEVIGGVAYRNFQTVKQRFYDLVLKADVGVIDVAWMTKEEHSTRIDQLTKDRSFEFKLLDAEFEEVLQRGNKKYMSTPDQANPEN